MYSIYGLYTHSPESVHTGSHMSGGFQDMSTRVEGCLRHDRTARPSTRVQSLPITSCHLCFQSILCKNRQQAGKMDGYIKHVLIGSFGWKSTAVTVPLCPGSCMDVKSGPEQSRRHTTYLIAWRPLYNTCEAEFGIIPMRIAIPLA